MTEPRDDDAFDGIDGPRPLPPELRDRLVASIVAAGGPLAGIDAPRPMPAAARQRVESSLAGKAARKHDLRPRVVAAVAAFILLAGVAAVTTRPERKATSTAIGGTAVGQPTTTTTTTAPPPPATVGPLASSEPVVITLDFKSSCGELLDYLQTNGAEHVTAYGLGGDRGGDQVPRSGVATGAGGQATAAAVPQSASTTNIQEKGVDEPDVVQNDGRYIYVLAGTALRVVDAGSSPPQLVASVDIAQPSWNMFLTGDQLVVLAPNYIVDDTEAGTGRTTLRVTTIDVSDPSVPVVADAIELDGYFVSARLVNGLVRVVTSASPRVPVQGPTDPSPEAMEAALEANRAAVVDSTIEQWIGDRSCSSVGFPNEFSGFDLTTVYTVDPGALSAADSASVVAGGEMIYASTSNLYVTSMRWEAWQAPEDAGQVAGPRDAHTQVHRFDITGAGAPRYIASGQVTGYAVGQYALSEQDGDLRIATTNHAQWDPADETAESAVTVLRLRDGELREVGHVGGLGPGETIQGVRFVGDIGFVVTFHRVWATDPLFVVDLRDPTNPQVRGALEVTGYSGYLHPVEPGFLVGVGQEGDENGQLTGAQVSVFDVRDLDNPTLVERVEFGGGYSRATDDPHAFLHWAPRSLVVVPLSSQMMDGAVILLHADGDGVSVVGRVALGKASQCDCSPAPERTLVIGDTLYSISSWGGVQATNLDTLADEGWVPFV